MHMYGLTPPEPRNGPGMGPKAHVFDHQSEIWYAYMEEKDMLTCELNLL